MMSMQMPTSEELRLGADLGRRADVSRGQGGAARQQGRQQHAGNARLQKPA